MKIFVGNARSFLNNRALEHMEIVRSHLRANREHQLLEFDPIASDRPRDIEQKRTEHLQKCDLFVALCEEGSTLLGAYLERAATMLKTTALFLPERLKNSGAHQDLLHLIASHPAWPATLDFYKDETDGVSFDIGQVLWVIGNRHPVSFLPKHQEGLPAARA